MRRLTVLEAHGKPAFAEQLQRVWDAGDAALLLDPRLPEPARRRVLAAARPDEPVEDDDALVVTTSGTTGTPKAVVLTHAAIAASAHATSRHLAVDPARDRWLACLPLAHVGGLGVVTRALVTGTPVTVADRADPAVVAAGMRDGCTLTSLVPTLLGRVDPSGFRAILLGGSAMPPDLPANAVPTYGMTETGGGVVYDGVPLDGVEVRVAAPGSGGAVEGDVGRADEKSGRAVEGPGQVAAGCGEAGEASGGAGEGEVFLRGPMLARGYRDGTDPRDAEGWLATGDAGRWDAGAGRLSVVGRIGDLVISGGENVWPVAVENAVATHPEVAEVVVFGRADPEWGQRVVARVVPRSPEAPPSLDELRDHVKQTLPPWSAPRELELAEALPRTALGKVIRPQPQPTVL